jgi:hypothetical protein
VADCFELGNEPSGSIKGGEFLEKLIHYQLVKEDCASLCKLHIHSTNIKFLKTSSGDPSFKMCTEVVCSM